MNVRIFGFFTAFLCVIVLFVPFKTFRKSGLDWQLYFC